MEGMHVVAADVEDGPLTETVELIGGDAIAVSCDVSASESVDALADAAFDAFGEVHLLCNNAGVFQAGSVWDATVTEWEWALGVNVWGIIHGIRAFVPRMLAQGSEGHVVNTSSLAAFMSGSMTAPYNVSKVAAFGLTEALGEGLRAAGSSIGASVLVPGSVKTRIAESRRNRPQSLVEGDADAVALVETGLAGIIERGIDPADVAGLVLDAVRTGQFVIPTSAGYDEQVTARTEALLRRELPEPLASF